MQPSRGAGFKTLWREIKIICLILYLFAIIILLAPIFIVCVISRSFVWLLWKCSRPDLKSFVNSVDSLLLFENQARAPINILIAIVIEGQFTTDRAREIFLERVLSLREPKGQLAYWKLQHFYTHFWLYPFWKKEAGFSLSEHLRPYDLPGELELPEICYETDLCGIIGPLTQRGWDPSKSPWEILLHHGFRSTKEQNGPKTLCILRTNHVLGDGLSIVDLMRKWTQGKFLVPNLQSNARRNLSGWEKIALPFKIPYDLAVGTLNILESKKFRDHPMPELMERKYIFSVSPKVSVEVIKSIKNRWKVGFNSVVASVILGAIQRGISAGREDGNLPEHLGSAYVAPLPDHPGGMSNHALVMAARLPCLKESPETRLMAVDKCISNFSRSSYPLIALKLAFFPQFFPTALKTASVNLSGGSPLTYIVCNFPAVTSQDFVDEREFLDTFGIFSGVRTFDMVTAVFGLNNQIRFNFCVEKSLFASEEIATALGYFATEELDHLIQNSVV